MCGGLKQNGTHRLIWVCTIRKCDFVGEGVSLGIQSLKSSSQFTFCSCRSKLKLLAPSPAPCLHASCCASCHGNDGQNLGNYKPTPIKCFSL